MYKLYWCKQTAAFGPQAALEEIGAAHEIVPIDIYTDEHLTPDYLALNPAGKIPALKLPDGTVMHEAAAIMLYLAEAHDRTDLAPALDDPIRGDFLSAYFYLTNTVQDGHKQFYYPQRFTTDQDNSALVKDRARANIPEYWKPVEQRLLKAGPFHFGDRYTLCDMYTVMLITWAPDTKQLLTDFPGLKRCFKAALERPAMAKAMDLHR